MKLHHYGVTVKQLEESLEFYKRHWGFKEESRFEILGEKIVFLTRDNFRLELVFSKDDQHLNTHICFEVNDLNNVIAQCKALRKIEGPYMLDNGWKTVFYEGPNQEVVEFLQVKNTEGKLDIRVGV